jgi:hypothetical protein
MKVTKLPQDSVQWPLGTEAEWIGRNGYFTSIGLVVQSWNGRVALHPVGTRGKIGNCMIEIPKAAIPDVIQSLCKAMISPEREIASPLRAECDSSTPSSVASGKGEPLTILRMDQDFMKDVERR